MQKVKGFAALLDLDILCYGLSLAVWRRKSL